MYVQGKIASKNFTGKTESEAYTKAIKWIYEHLYNLQDEVSKFSYEVENVKNGNLPTCRLSIYCLVDEEAEFMSMCNACKEMHQLFYLNQKDECGTCKIMSYRKRIEEKLERKKDYYVEHLFEGKVKRTRKKN